MPTTIRQRADLDRETYELLVQQAIRRDMTITAYAALLIRRGVRTSDVAPGEPSAPIPSVTGA